MLSDIGVISIYTANADSYSSGPYYQLAASTWYQIVITYTGGNAYYYINGILVANGAMNAPGATTDVTMYAALVLPADYLVAAIGILKGTAFTRYSG